LGTPQDATAASGAISVDAASTRRRESGRAVASQSVTFR
jgi:hypothetical protein